MVYLLTIIILILSHTPVQAVGVSGFIKPKCQETITVYENRSIFVCEF